MSIRDMRTEKTPPKAGRGIVFPPGGTKPGHHVFRLKEAYSVISSPVRDFQKERIVF